MRSKKFSLSVTVLAISAVGSQAFPAKQEQRLFDGMIAAAKAVVAVEILSTDYTATPADGPMVASARVLKNLKGPLTSGKKFRFSETAWVGPTYQKGEYRILFLENTGSSEFPRVSEWRILSRLDARTNFYFEKDSLPKLSLESLESLLKKLKSLRIGRNSSCSAAVAQSDTCA